MAKSLWLALAVLAALFSPTAAHAQTGPGSCVGIVRAVSSTSITIDQGGKRHILKITAATQIYAHAALGRLADIKVGVQVLARFSVDTKRCSEIRVGVGLAAGVVVDVDATLRLLHLDTNLDARVDLTVCANAGAVLKLGDILLDPTEIAALIGVRADLCFDIDTRNVCELQGSPKGSQECRGTVLDIDATLRILKIRKITGEIVDCLVPLGAKVLIGARVAVNLAEVLVNDVVVCTVLPKAIGLATCLAAKVELTIRTLTCSILDVVGGTTVRLRTTTGAIINAVLDPACRITSGGKVISITKLLSSLLGGLLKCEADCVDRGGVTVCVALRVKLSLF
jgi:hypothetical protein